MSSTLTAVPSETTLLAEGKTKRILDVGRSDGTVWIFSKDDVTAGDGAKHDIIPGKGALATQTTCNVFRLLQAHGVPVAFTEQINEQTFSAPLCDMLPYEVVTRGRAWGSYLTRHPEFIRGYAFMPPIVEFFLKTNNCRWHQWQLPCDDPLMEYVPGDDVIRLHHPGKVFGLPFLGLSANQVLSRPNEWRLFKTMSTLARLVFTILEEAWHKQQCGMIDLKIEFGLHRGQLLVADVIDADSWRVLDAESQPLSKQLYRDGGSLEDMKRVLEHVAASTKQFLPDVKDV